MLLDIVFVIYYTLLLDAFLSNLFPYLLLSCILGKKHPCIHLVTSVPGQELIAIGQPERRLNS